MKLFWIIAIALCRSQSVARFLWINGFMRRIQALLLYKWKYYNVWGF